MRAYDFYFLFELKKKDLTIVDETKFGLEYDSRF